MWSLYKKVLIPIRCQTQCNKIELYPGCSSFLFASVLVSLHWDLYTVVSKRYNGEFLSDMILFTLYATTIGEPD